MAVHPFARRCEEIIAYLRDLLAHLKRTKEAAKKPQTDDKDRKSGRIFDFPVIWLLGSPQMENQALVFGSERGINQNYDKAQGKGPKLRKGGDPQFNRLYYLYQKAPFECNKKQERANEAYYRCVAKKDGSPAKCKHLFVKRECREAVQALAAMDEYSKNKKNRTGDGGGGGF